jgi:membrane protein
MERAAPITIKPSQIVPWIALGAFVLLWRHKPPASSAASSPSLSDARDMSPGSFDTAEPGRGRAARHVRRIPRRGWRDIAWRVYQEIGKDRLPIVAGGVTFYTLLALFPALGAFVALYGLVADVNVVETQIAQLWLILPPDVVTLLADQMRRIAAARDGALSLTFIFSLVLAIWSANAGVSALFDGMNIAYGEAEKRNWFKRRLLTLSFTAGLVAVVTALAFLLIAIPCGCATMASPRRTSGGRRSAGSRRWR